MNQKILIGCIADDFTGASDAASFIKKAGISTVLYSDVPKDGRVPDCEAIVIALKSRSQNAGMAVRDSLKALQWLKRCNVGKIYMKYCSTFDSTEKGNIGPVADAILEELNQKYTVLCPSLPVNNRTVKNGILYVDGLPLDKTHMRNHPLTPMWSSSIKTLMESQSKYKCLELPENILLDKEMCFEYIKTFGENKKHFYLIPDYFEENHGNMIADIMEDCRVLTGGSGLVEKIAKKIARDRDAICVSEKDTGLEGKTLILAGSCSAITLKQIEYYKIKGLPSLKIDPLEVVSGDVSLENVWKKIVSSKADSFLIYSSDSSDHVRRVQRSGKSQISEQLEQFAAEIAFMGINNGFNKIIVAGGETSGAVTKKLGFASYHIGVSIEPGVPVMTPVCHPDIRLVLKSGNFGKEDFFVKSIEVLNT